MTLGQSLNVERGNEPRVAAWLFGAGLLILVALLAYANHFHNSFHFDDAHTIENNAAIRQLRNILLFFRDATTFSSLPSNQSYRPLVTAWLALDYWLAGGLNPFWFHVSNFVLFLVLVALLVFVIQQLLIRNQDTGHILWIPTAAAALYALHPANADTINYVIAVADIMSTAGVLASFALYFALPQLRRYSIFILPALIAILAKPPAAIFPVLLVVYHLLFRPADGGLGSRRKIWLIEVLPSFVFCAAAVLFVNEMTPAGWVAGAADARNYLITQPYVALLYFKTFLWPTSLSADYDLNPFVTTDDPRFWIGFLFLGLFLAAAVATSLFRRTRVIGFGLWWFLVGLLPTSLFPLAEVMNDHRTFLSYVGLAIAFAGTISFLFARLSSRAAVRAGIVLLVFLCLTISGYATWQRNKVWKTEETLWQDVTVKSPANARGLMNYGNALMAKGDLANALLYFRRARVLAPRYSVLLINLAIAEDATGQWRPAEQHFREALELAPASPESYIYYARSLLAHLRVGDAQTLIKRALQLSPGDVQAQEVQGQANRQPSPRTGNQTPESYLALSLQNYQAGHYPEAILASRLALMLRPRYPEAWNNICAAYNKMSQYDKAAAACRHALALNPDFELARNNLRHALRMGKESPKQ